MSFIAAAVIGGGLGAIGGAYAGSQARKGQEAQARAQGASFEFSKPYIGRNYDRAEDALNTSLGKGAYTGQTYAGPNGFQLTGNNMIGNAGQDNFSGAQGIINSGQNFGQNFNDLYAQGGADRLGNAQNYAQNNYQGLVNSAMRDDYRNLQENTLTGINQGASGTGNMNSSRAGVQDAIANRGYDDRRADVTANIQNQLFNQSLDQQNLQFGDRLAANAGIQNAYMTGINGLGTMGDFMTNAGQNLQGYQQGALNDQRYRFEDDRDFALNQNVNYQQGILGQADYNSPQNPIGVTASPLAGAFGGAMSGVGLGMDLSGYLQRRPQGPTGTSGVTSSGQLPWNMMDFG